MGRSEALDGQTWTNHIQQIHKLGHVVDRAVAGKLAAPSLCAKLPVHFALLAFSCLRGHRKWYVRQTHAMYSGLACSYLVRMYSTAKAGETPGTGETYSRVGTSQCWGASTSKGASSVWHMPVHLRSTYIVVVVCTTTSTEQYMSPSSATPPSCICSALWRISTACAANYRLPRLHAKPTSGCPTV